MYTAVLLICTLSLLTEKSNTWILPVHTASRHTTPNLFRGFGSCRQKICALYLSDNMATVGIGDISKWEAGLLICACKCLNSPHIICPVVHLLLFWFIIGERNDTVNHYSYRKQNELRMPGDCLEKKVSVALWLFAAFFLFSCYSFVRAFIQE